MSPARSLLPLLLVLCFTPLLLAQQPKPVDDTKKAPGDEGAAAKSAAKASGLILHLMEGSVVSGRLSVDTITVDTEFGKLEVPVQKIISFTPGLNSHPQQRQKIQTLILQLGANKAELRGEAQKELSGLGLAIRKLLEPHRDDADPERKKRIGELLAELEQLAEEEEFGQEQPHELIDEDTIETTLFTVVGKISPQSFQVQTKFGPLSVALSDIRRGEHETEEQPEVRRTVAVSGQNIVLVSYKNSGIRVARGDQIELSASGSIVMSPWGNNQSSGPNGGSNFGQYRPGIFGGALVARIGSGGQEFKVGSSHKFTAKKSGTLYFAIAMQPQFANRNYQFPGEYKVKVRVNPK